MYLFECQSLKSKYKSKIENFLESLGYKNTIVKILKTEEYTHGFKISIFLSSNIRNVTLIGQFKLVEMPGCCGILISTGTYISENFRGKGIAKFLQTIKEEIAKETGYTVLYCTTVESNKAQIHILESFGWKKVNTFINRRTGNTVSEFVKEIQNPVVELNSDKEK